LTFRAMTSSRREVCEDWYCKWRNKNMRILAWRCCLHKSYITSVSEEISCPILEAAIKRTHLGAIQWRQEWTMNPEGRIFPSCGQAELWERKSVASLVSPCLWSGGVSVCFFLL
jgi:hypothetical protein